MRCDLRAVAELAGRRHHRVHRELDLRHVAEQLGHVALLPAKLLLLLPHNQAAHPVQGTIKPGMEFFLCPVFLQQNAPERFIGNLPAHFSEAVIRSRMPPRQRAMLILIFPRTGSPVLQRAGSSQWAMVLCPFSGGKGHAAPTAAGTPQWNGDPVQCLPCPLQTRPA